MLLGCEVKISKFMSLQSNCWTSSGFFNTVWHIYCVPKLCRNVRKMWRNFDQRGPCNWYYFLPPARFINHLSQINSLCRWWQYVHLKRKNKRNTLRGAKIQKINIIWISVFLRGRWGEVADCLEQVVVSYKAHLHLIYRS